MIDSKIKGTWIADELENGDFGYLTDLNGAPELPENFGNIWVLKNLEILGILEIRDILVIF